MTKYENDRIRTIYEWLNDNTTSFSFIEQKITRKCGKSRLPQFLESERYKKIAKELVESEREACAKVCEEFSKRDDDMGAIIATAIRARGEE